MEEPPLVKFLWFSLPDFHKRKKPVMLEIHQKRGRKKRYALLVTAIFTTSQRMHYEILLNVKSSLLFGIFWKRDNKDCKIEKTLRFKWSSVFL